MTNIGIRRRHIAPGVRSSLCRAGAGTLRLRQAVTNAGALVRKGSEGHRNVAR